VLSFAVLASLMLPAAWLAAVSIALRWRRSQAMRWTAARPARRSRLRSATVVPDHGRRLFRVCMQLIFIALTAVVPRLCGMERCWPLTLSQ